MGVFCLEISTHLLSLGFQEPHTQFHSSSPKLHLGEVQKETDKTSPDLTGPFGRERF